MKFLNHKILKIIINYLNMDENNPLFDLCKIKIELLFLNENISNLQNYENNLVFYMNKYLWKMKIDNSIFNPSKEEDEPENPSQFYYFEFYTKNLNAKSLNIPDSNLLSNKTNFYCYLLFIFDTKEEFNSKDGSTNSIINMLSSRSTPNELSHLLIICNKNLDLSFITNILDKNTYDIINTWENNNIKKNHKDLEKVLKNILVKYRIYAINKKLDIDEKINEDLKIKKNLEILDSYIKIGNYQKSIDYLRELKRSFKLPKVLALFNECQVLLNFLIDYNNSYIKGDCKMEYKKEIENGFLDAIEDYRYLNQIYLMVHAYLKLIYYLSYFNTIKIKQNINDIIYDLYDEKMDDDSKSKMFSNISFLIYLNLSHIFNKINFKRKFFLLLFRAYKNYLNNYKLNESYGNLSYIDLLIKNIEKYFLKDNTNIDLNYYNYDYGTFLQLCNLIKKSHYNSMNFSFPNNNEIEQEKNTDDNFYLNKGPLSISGIFKGYHQVFHHILWELIQKKIYNILMKYYKGIKNYDKTILFSLELLQICYNILPTEKQTKFINIIQKKSSKIKYINSFNVVNIPILLKIIPLPSEIKFDYFENNEEKGDDLFIFNPWSKKNEKKINYYWTLNSIQSIIIIVYNPLSIEITLNEIKFLYNIKNKNSDNNNLFNFIPCSIVIPPKHRIEYKFHFKPSFEEIFDIIGIEYFFQGVKLKQYIKESGNGLLFRYKNMIDDLYNSSKKDNISLNNIKIYPEIPLVRFIPLNSELIEDTPLSLFIFQKYTFNFDIFNISDKPIKQINVAIYAYKKVDYKISLYETVLKSGDNQINKPYLEPNKRKKFSYDFIQKKNYIKIEFILYYIYYDEEKKNQNKIKPFLYFKKDLNYRNLFYFSNPEINPVYTNMNFKKILTLEKNYSRYFTSIISNNFHLSFALKLLFLCDKKVSFEIFSLDKNENKDSLLDKGEFTKDKNFKIFVDKSKKISKTYIFWKIEENKIEGIINCFDLLRNIFNKDVEQNFDFDIIKNIKEDYIDFMYNIQNNTKFSYFNMKVKILLYQEDSKNINMSISLQDDIFVDGQLIHMIDEIKPREKISINVRLYPKKGTIFSTTFLLIDQKSGILYMPSFSVSHI